MCVFVCVFVSVFLCVFATENMFAKHVVISSPQLNLGYVHMYFYVFVFAFVRVYLQNELKSLLPNWIWDLYFYVFVFVFVRVLHL